MDRSFLFNKRKVSPKNSYQTKKFDKKQDNDPYRYSYRTRPMRLKSEKEKEKTQKYLLNKGYFSIFLRCISAFYMHSFSDDPAESQKNHC